MTPSTKENPAQGEDGGGQEEEKTSATVPKYCECQNQTKKPECDAAKPKRGPWWLFHQFDPISGFTAWIAIFTALLMIVSGIQVWAFIQSERAFIYPWTTLSSQALIADKQVVVTFNVRNSGRSGAFVVDANVTYVSVPSKDSLPETPAYVIGAVNAVTGPIPQGSSFKAEVPLQDEHGAPLKFNQADIDAINNKTHRLYVFGWIKYTDDFSFFGPKTTGFCGVYVPGQTTENTFFNCGRLAYVYAR